MFDHPHYRCRIYNRAELYILQLKRLLLQVPAPMLFRQRTGSGPQRCTGTALLANLKHPSSMMRVQVIGTGTCLVNGNLSFSSCWERHTSTAIFHFPCRCTARPYPARWPAQLRRGHSRKWVQPCVDALEHLGRLSRNGGHVVGQAELGGFRRTGNTHSHCRHDARGVHPEWTDPSSRCNVGSRIAYIGKLPEEML